MAAVLMRIRRRRDANERRQLIDGNRVRLRQLRDSSDPFMMTNELFTGKYRLSIERARWLIEEIRPILPFHERSHAVPVEIKVLCALHFYAHGSYQKSAGSDAYLGLSQPSVSRAIEQVTVALNSGHILTGWINFPSTREKRLEIIQKNFRAFQFPGILGFIDGTHVAIRAPYEHEELYVNRKSFHSLNVQIVCDAELYILNVLARYPGSSHDSFVWRNSSLRNKMQEISQMNELCWLLGDSGYPSEPWLHTPILNAVPGTPEALYNVLHIRARNSVERCIGLLKARFRCLLKHRVMEYTPQKAGLITNACCVLHNICLAANLPPPIEELPPDHLEVVAEPVVEEYAQRHLYNEAMRIRANIIQRLAV